MYYTPGYYPIIFMAFGFKVWGMSLSAKTNEPSRCDRLYRDFVQLRNAIVQDPSFEKERRPLIVGIDVQDVPILLGIDTNDDQQWKNLACAIADAEDIYDISDVLGLPVGVIRQTILDDMKQFYDRMNPRFHGYRTALLTLASWANGSGFPDSWPLRSSWTRTYSVIQKARKYNLVSLVAFGAPSFITARSITTALLEARNLSGFLRRIGSNDLLNAPETLQRLVENSRSIITPQGAQAKINTLRAGLTLVETLNDLGIMKMKDDH